MVDVGDRPSSRRQATASGQVLISEAAHLAISQSALPKGNPFEVARLAGIMAAKRTAELIPLCHPLAITHIEVDVGLQSDPYRVVLQATVRCQGSTGVEMEALTAVAVAGLTVVDMIKSVDPWAQIDGVAVQAKSGGKSGALARPAPDAAS